MVATVCWVQPLPPIGWVKESTAPAVVAAVITMPVLDAATEPPV